MAVEICSETSSTSSSGWVMSPRISFSHNFSQTETIPIDHHRLDSCLLDSPSPDFDFCIAGPHEQSSSSADELFFNGKILPLPIQIQSKTPKVFPTPISEIPQNPDPKTPKYFPIPPPPPSQQRKESLREIMASSETDEKSNSVTTTASSKSFWRFTRSSSLNCASSYKKICSFSPLLSRSNSTGSTNQNPKVGSLKEGCKPLQKPPLNSNTKISWPASSSSSSAATSYSSVQKPPPPLKKNNSGGRSRYGPQNNMGFRINPVLNVPPPYISKGTTSLFSFFLSGKDTKNKKKPSSASR